MAKELSGEIERTPGAPFTELASWYERVAVPSVRPALRPHGSINNNEKEEEPHGINPAEGGLRRPDDHPENYHPFGFSLDSPRL
jgi:hypothetical protein